MVGWFKVHYDDWVGDASVSQRLVTLLFTLNFVFKNPGKSSMANFLSSHHPSHYLYLPFQSADHTIMPKLHNLPFTIASLVPRVTVNFTFLPHVIPLIVASFFIISNTSYVCLDLLLAGSHVGSWDTVYSHSVRALVLQSGAHDSIIHSF